VPPSEAQPPPSMPGAYPSSPRRFSEQSLVSVEPRPRVSYSASNPLRLDVPALLKERFFEDSSVCEGSFSRNRHLSDSAQLRPTSVGPGASHCFRVSYGSSNFHQLPNFFRRPPTQTDFA